jgi:Arc/MetJ-type ribon-helix-helix transcriptional regulator
MTITLSPDQERAIRDAIRAGQITSVEELIQKAIAALPRRRETLDAGGSVFEQGLGLFGSPEDAALLDEVVSIAYEERHRPGKQESDL